MKVHELVETLQRLPDQNATVKIGQWQSPNVWLIVTGLVERKIAASDENPDYVVSGAQHGCEIV